MRCDRHRGRHEPAAALARREDLVRVLGRIIEDEFGATNVGHPANLEAFDGAVEAALLTEGQHDLRDILRNVDALVVDCVLAPE